MPPFGRLSTQHDTAPRSESPTRLTTTEGDATIGLVRLGRWGRREAVAAMDGCDPSHRKVQAGTPAVRE
jgi:hypothetical protein